MIIIVTDSARSRRGLRDQEVFREQHSVSLLLHPRLVLPAAGEFVVVGVSVATE